MYNLCISLSLLLFTFITRLKGHKGDITKCIFLKKSNVLATRYASSMHLFTLQIYVLSPLIHFDG